MKTIFLTLIILLSAVKSHAQNLVPNGDFELYNFLPTTYMQWHACQDWNNTSFGMDFPFGTPDYLHTNGSMDVQLPNNIFATVPPYSGDAIMGICLVSLNPEEFREYLSAQLVTPMVSGMQYSVSFWLTNGESNHYCTNSSNHFGVQFSTVQPVQNDYFPINGYPQYEIPGEFWSTDWQQITFNFVADSNYTFITFGNFFPDSQTTSTQQVAGSSEASYYFIDKVEVIPNDNLIIESEVCAGDSLTLSYYFPDSNYTWVNAQSPSIILSQEDSLTVAPPQNSTYYLIGTSDTVIFEVDVNEFSLVNPLGPDLIQCYTSAILLDATTAEASYIWQNNSVNPTLSVDTSGLYWVDITVENCTFRDSMIVQLLDCYNAVLEIPNVFTPNGDGSNDLFIPISSSGIASMETTIVNRWGHLVFETNDPNINWSGDTFNDGIYFWTIRYTNLSGKENNLHGFVTLRR